MTSGRPRRAGEARGAGGPGWGAALLGGLLLLAAGCGEGAGEEGTPAPACTGPQCPPANPVCYSPCRDHLPRPDGTLAVCSTEGLLEGCLGGNVCVLGACQPPGSDGQVAVALAADPIYPACLEDGQCPDFQRCLGGRCYSDCQQDGDCTSPQRCRRHVCRRPCNTETDPCPEADELCLAGDGQNGFCLPRGPHAAAGPPAVAGGFTVSERLLAFSNVRPGGFFWIGNESAAEVAFTVRKLRHTEHGDDGEIVIASHPLSWLQLGPVGELSQEEAVTFVLGPWEERELQVAGAVNPDRELDRWEGVLQIDGGLLGQRELSLTYTSRADGQWLGSMYYFGSFRDEGLDAWQQDGDRSHLQNALLSFWDEFKKGQRDLSTFRAMLDATIQETWRLPTLEEEEECAGSATVCFPDDNAQGYTVFTQDVRHNPIPTGVVEFPFALNLRQDGSPTRLTGRIPTDLVLHYAGDPAVSLELGEDPATAAPNDAGVVLVPVTGLAATVLVGGRYLPADATDGSCEAYADGSYALHPVPWLVEGFLAGTVERDGRRYRDECRDTRLPHSAAGDLASAAAENRSQAAANPIPDGRTRERHLELVDGALVNQDTLLLLVRERFVSFLGADDATGFAAYALLLLERGPTDLEEEAYRGTVAVEERTFDEGLLHVGCSSELLDEIAAATGRPRLDPDDLADALVLAQLVTEGRDSTPVTVLGADGDEEVHWYCEDTGVFDGLVLRGGLPVLVPCPESSRVRYFATTKSGVEVEAPPGVWTLDIDDACEDSLVLGEVASLDPAVADALADTVRVAVEQRGECWSTLENWVRTGGRGVRLDPLWSCAGEQPTCDGDRLDPRRGKLFYAAPTQVADCDETCCAELGQIWVDGGCRTPGPAYLPAAAQLQSAFRYKTRFRSRRGENPGFVPEICQPGSDAIPYCYDPGEIESLARRVDCALSLRGTLQGRAPAEAAQLRDFLRLQFAYAETTDEYNRVTVHDGFERLYAELLIMLGDEAYTAAFASRFDLAGSAVRSFEGELFEPTGGITLAGGAGHEMVMLYQATQYYGLALDRFYALSPLVWQELAAAAADPAQGSYITLATVTAYFDRLIRASTQKARAWSEIGTRYAGFGRADLARQVVARAYTATYLESVVLSRMMLRMQQVVTLGDWPQISERVELAQLGYRSALLAMREVYDGIHDERTYFGFPPDHVPFPALDPLDVNAFEKMLALAREQTATAAVKEELALASSREFDTDAAAFQSELVSIRQNYETELARLCGTFQAADGKIYPAIRKYLELHPDLSRLNVDPCGLVATGEITAATGELQVAMLNVAQARDDIQSLIAAVGIEQERVAAQCGLIADQLSFVSDMAIGINVLKGTIALAQLSLEGLEWLDGHLIAEEKVGKCDGVTSCAQSKTAKYALKALHYGNMALRRVQQGYIQAAEVTIGVLESQTTRWVTAQQCDVAEVDSEAKVRTLLLDLSHLQLDLAKAAEGLRLAGARLLGLQQEAERLQQEQQETERLAVDTAAARSDPNFRIYRNDAVLTADRTFQTALRTVYKATRVLEYGTGQRYAHLDDLFLVRMVAHGDTSLEAYLARLESEHLLFEERYGNPDLRVMALSLKDDLLEIPRLDLQSLPLTDGQRTELLRTALADPSRIDGRGYVVVPFATRLDQLSPLTHNHKIHHVEAQLLGSNLGDALARVYLSQGGTGVVVNGDGEQVAYRLPALTAVLNAIVGDQRVFQGNVFDGDVYLNRRLRDRPVVNSGWQLGINLRDEAVNQDLDLGSLDDLRIYVYYNDFTVL